MIKIESLNKSFEERQLFQDFNLEIPDHSFAIISGNSGCGKTTLLNMLGGIERPDSGRIVVDGVDITKLKKRRNYFKNVAGFLFQNFALLENKTVRQNLELIEKNGRTGITVSEALEKVALSGMENKKVYKLSGGEQQRVALARLLMKRSSLVLADEPTGSLDEKNSGIVMDILHRLNDMGKTVIVVTHNAEIVSREKFVIQL